MPDINILSGGAAQALVRAVEPAFRQATGHGIEGQFGAVGAMRARLAEGAQPDVVILTAAIVAELVAGGLVAPDSVADLGDVETAIAVRDGDPVPPVGDGAALREALLAADAIYFPDPKLATAGIHFAGVIDKLGIGATVADRLRTYPNGASAMAALASAPEAHPIGCTQVTEIKAVAGVALVAELPPGLSLATRYTAGVTTRASKSVPAQDLVKLLTSDATADHRRRTGFV
ncbi:MAG: substrate-binding domain-containing protein [Bosea sp. (in: a-proteobacteria)]|uniref:substrate-binding domain-containing protein n=1 Tax=Bosea sp. (in: a-proteobacteria) TaxID=1871050 RepID=UPI0027365C6D|nr:substrate-binding domain-containing protein [Bosea sp. (in: a-proteobacteria)]MDP3254582.1 substrate-binding domain-containing protein [Bosea sp. (in: a-proteobacteria)]MDP3318503.1 substrate-binding domain-containing protein [Bosea sp. (in: a-proteobacteria)]